MLYFGLIVFYEYKYDEILSDIEAILYCGPLLP